MGTIWGAPGEGRPIITVYVNPIRYTDQILQESDRFTIGFYPEENRDDLLRMGSRSSRSGDRLKGTRLKSPECSTVRMKRRIGCISAKSSIFWKAEKTEHERRFDPKPAEKPAFYGSSRACFFNSSMNFLAAMGRAALSLYPIAIVRVTGGSVGRRAML